MKIKVSLFQCAVGLAILAISLRLFLSVGVLSTGVIVLAIVPAIAAAVWGVAYRTELFGPGFRGSPKSIAALLFLGALIGIVAGFSLWMHPRVMSDRLTTVCRNKLGVPSLNISISQNELFLLNVSGNLQTEDDFSRLRDDLCERFTSEPPIHVFWNIHIAEGPDCIWGERIPQQELDQ